jgi:hypothetical protein
MFLMITILTGMRWNLRFWFAFPLWSGMVSISSLFFDHLDFLLWKSSCLVQLPVSLFVHWFWESLVFWATCIFWLSVLCLMCSWQIFSPTLWVVSSVYRTTSFVMQKLFHVVPFVHPFS